jgi:hypothetical protein
VQVCRGAAGTEAVGPRASRRVRGRREHSQKLGALGPLTSARLDHGDSAGGSRARASGPRGSRWRGQRAHDRGLALQLSARCRHGCPRSERTRGSPERTGNGAVHCGEHDTADRACAAEVDAVQHLGTCCQSPPPSASAPWPPGARRTTRHQYSSALAPQDGAAAGPSRSAAVHSSSRSSLLSRSKSHPPSSYSGSASNSKPSGSSPFS